MSLALAVLGTIIAAVFVALAVVLVRFNLKRLRIARIAALRPAPPSSPSMD